MDFFSELARSHPANGLVRWCLAWALQGRFVVQKARNTKALWSPLAKDYIDIPLPARSALDAANSREAFIESARLGSPLVEILPDGNLKMMNLIRQWWTLNLDNSSQQIDK